MSEASGIQTIETVATIDEDGTLTAKMPPEIASGQHRAVIVLDRGTGETSPQRSTRPLELRVSAWEGWPADSTFRREDMYGDDGR